MIFFDRLIAPATYAVRYDATTDKFVVVCCEDGGTVRTFNDRTRAELYAEEMTRKEREG